MHPVPQTCGVVRNSVPENDGSLSFLMGFLPQSALSHCFSLHTNIAKSANFVSDDQHRIPHTDGSRDAGMESSENASIFKTQKCHWFRLEFCLCIQRVFVSVQQKSPVWGLFVRHSTAYFYFSRYLPIMQPLFGRHQRPSVKLTPAKSSAVKT